MSWGEISASCCCGPTASSIFSDAFKEQFFLTHARKALQTTRKAEEARSAVLQSVGKLSTADNAAVVVVVFNFPDPTVAGRETSKPQRTAPARVSLQQLEQAAA